MPHIAVTMLPGRSRQKKRELAEAVRECAARILEVPSDDISVEETEVSLVEWGHFYRSQIRDNPDLVLAPAYAEKGDFS